MPITCRTCQRTSALGLPVAGLQDRLDTGSEIALRCGFDGKTWNAGPRERARIAKLCRENKAVPRHDAFRLHIAAG